MTTNLYSNNLGSDYGILELNQKDFNLALKFDQDDLNNWNTPFMDIQFI